MIDKEWLKSVSCLSHDGVEIQGLAGMGTKKIVFKAKTADGKDVVVYATRKHFGFHINEIPPFLTPKPQYDVLELNRKLQNLIGDTRIDSWSQSYDKLYNMILGLTYKSTVKEVVHGLSIDSVDTVPFILRSPGMQARLIEFAEWPDHDPSEPLSIFVEVGSIKGLVPQVQTWARKTLEAIEELPECIQEYSPVSLHFNPLYVWGAAVTDGFFTDEELPIAADHIERNFGPIVEREDLGSIVFQIDAIGNLMAQCSKDSPVERLVRLAALCGVIFQARDSSGHVIADGLEVR